MNRRGSRFALILSIMTCSLGRMAHALDPMQTQMYAPMSVTDFPDMMSLDGVDQGRMIQQIPFEEPVDEKEYQIGPGDELQVFVGKGYSLTVSPESNVMFPGLQPIPLEGLTLADAKKKIVESLGRHFKKDLIYVNLSQIKSIKIPVLGEVNKPALYAVPANTRLSELIVKTEGFAKTAKAPWVNIVRKDGSIQEVNLGEYYRTGNNAQNPYVRMGDRVLVPRIDPSRPKVELLLGTASYFYQLVGTRKLGEILTEMAGFAGARDLRAARLASGQVLTGVDMIEYAVKDGEVIELFGKELVVYVEGEVGHPYIYSYSSGKTVRDYIAEAGMSSSSQYKGKVKVVRKDGKTEGVEQSSSQVFPGDHIYVTRTTYATFKEYLITVSSIATIFLTAVYLIQISKSL
jgi:protein involved in polysaccharide export with SLBB domain